MRRQTIKALVTLLLVASLLAAVTLAVALAAEARWSGQDGLKSGKQGRLMRDVDEVYHAVTVLGSTDGTTTFGILNTAVKNRNGNVTLMKHATPIELVYSDANKTFTMAGHDRSKADRQRPVRTSYADAKIDPAGATVIVAAKNLTVLRHDADGSEIQFGSVAVYQPDGSVKRIAMGSPVKITKSRADRIATISDDPAVMAEIAAAMKAGGTKFPTGSAPVPLKTIDA